MGDDARAKFKLNGPDGPVELIEQDGFKLAEIREIGRAIAVALPIVCEQWNLYHG